MIKGNVQGGVIVSTHGDIEVERALVRSRLIAKTGNVRCQHIEDADCVFAWQTIAVSGAVLGGRLYGAAIRVGEKVSSGELHSCGQIDAPTFEVASRTAPIICLRKRLTCMDYGRSIDEATTARQKRVRQLQGQMELAEASNQFAQQLIHSSFRTALFYLVGKVENAQMVYDLQGLQLRSLYLRELIVIAESVGNFYGALIDEAREDTDSAEVFRKDALRTLRRIRKSVEGLPAEFGPSHRLYLLSRCEQFRAMADQIHQEYLRASGHDGTRDLLRNTLNEWWRILSGCESDIEDIVRRCSISPDLLGRMNGDAEELEALLAELVLQRVSGPDVEGRKRAQSPLLRILQDQVERYRRGVVQNQDLINAAREELDATREALAENSAVLYGDALPGDCCVQSKAFGRGVIVTTSVRRTEGTHADRGEVIVISEDIQRPTTFKLTNRTIQRLD